MWAGCAALSKRQSPPSPSFPPLPPRPPARSTSQAADMAALILDYINAIMATNEA